MRDPTLQDTERWATTPIATKVEKVLDKYGQEQLEPVWQRFKTGEKTISEVLEDSPTIYHLRRESAHSFRLVGVEDVSETTTTEQQNE